MKKKYSDPLMFSHTLAFTIPILDSQEGELDGAPEANLTLGSVSSVAIASANGDNATDVEIVDPDKGTESAITEGSIQSILSELLGEDTEEESVPSDESSIAD
jgi:hypothetical protein